MTPTWVLYGQAALVGACAGWAWWYGGVVWWAVVLVVGLGVVLAREVRALLVE